jgi:hypothetical protein
MKEIFKTTWSFIVILIVLTSFYFWGIQFIPFHPDESTQLFMSSDLETLFTDPTSMIWREDQIDNPRQRYRELDAPLTKYIIGFGRVIAGRKALPTDWDWGLSWDENIRTGAYPDLQLLTIARWSITALLPFSLLFIYSIGKRINLVNTHTILVLIFGSHALVLLHGRRSMAEGTLLFGITFALWTILKAREYPWLAGLGLAVAFNAKQSTIALLPAAIIALVWHTAYTKSSLKFIFKDIISFSSAFILVTFMLNPVYWGNPRKVIQESFISRQELLEQQIKDTLSIAPEKVLDTPLERSFVLLLNIFISPPEYGLVGNLTPTRSDVDAYIAIPGHNLLRGIVLGSTSFVLCIFGLYMAIRSNIKNNHVINRDLTLLLLATISQAAVLIAVLPLSWARYSIPMIPYTSIWIAFGVSFLISIQRRKSAPAFE